MTLLYLLVNKDRTAFKIGVSRNPYRRLSSFAVEVDLGASREAEMHGGDAYKIEGMLHYLFRHRPHEMPRGDGYTEWFEMEVLREVTAFLAVHRDKLGIGDVRALTIPEPPAKQSSSVGVRESREQRAERRARQREERLAHAKQHNSQALAWCEDVLSQIKEDNAFAGMVRPNPDKPFEGGYLFLQGANRREWAEKVFTGSGERNHLIGSGSSSVFCSVFHDPSHPCTQVEVGPDLLSDDQASHIEHEKYFPGWTAINTLLRLHAHDLGSPGDMRLREVHRALKASRDEFWAQLRNT